MLARPVLPASACGKPLRHAKVSWRILRAPSLRAAFTAHCQLPVAPAGGSQALSGWTVSFTWPGDAQITSAWGATAIQSGKSVTLTNASYDGSLAAGTTQSNIGFQGTWSSSDALPATVTCT